MQILVVEDEPRMARLLKRVLDEEGHQVVVSNDGREGFEMARSSTFDVIVLDVMLPGMDGVSVARKLRECRNQTPVLMLTARDAPGDVIRGLDSGADDYLTKPFSIDILLARKLRECRNQTPVLMLTARDAPGDVIRGLDSGADDYLTKPFSIDILLAR